MPPSRPPHCLGTAFRLCRAGVVPKTLHFACVFAAFRLAETMPFPTQAERLERTHWDLAAEYVGGDPSVRRMLQKQQEQRRPAAASAASSAAAGGQ